MQLGSAMAFSLETTITLMAGEDFPKKFEPAFFMIKKIIYWMPYIPFLGTLWPFFSNRGFKVCIWERPFDIHFYLSGIIQALSIVAIVLILFL